MLAREQNPPKGAKPLVWKLLSNREASGLDDAAHLIDWYRARWEIEMVFNVLNVDRRGILTAYWGDRFSKVTTDRGVGLSRGPDRIIRISRDGVS